MYSQQSLDQAMAHHTAGRLPQAEKLYQQILQSDPDQPDALHLLGVIAHQRGNNQTAVDLINQAVAVNPGHAAAHNNLGNALLALGKMDDAVGSYARAIAAKPGYAEAHSNLGVAYLAQDKIDDAIASFNAVLAIAPDHAGAHISLGNAFQRQGKLEDTVACYRKALTIVPDNAEIHNNLGVALQDLGHMADAVAAFRRAVGITPDYSEAFNNLGNALQSQGNIDDALTSYHQALAIAPDYAEAHRHLALTKKFTEYDNDIKAMEAAYAASGLNDQQKMHLAFGLGKSFEDLGQFDKAFGFFQTGNAIKRGAYEFSIDTVAETFEALKNLFTTEFFTHHQAVGLADATPIFVLGMLRSGTSLIEQILASHPRVHGAGELNYINRIVTSRFRGINHPGFAGSLSRASDDDLSGAGDDYIRMVRQRAGSAPFITDKMPPNFRLIGMIKLMLPKAKIIHCRRDPLDTCLSIFKNDFSAGGNDYAYDLGELGQYYTLYSDLMDHWHRVLPGFIYDIRYEDMVADQEAQSRALLDHCGLEWDAACLDFHQTDRPVHTASAVQVRRPIYTDSVQSWKHYEVQLAPLIEALG